MTDAVRLLDAADLAEMFGVCRETIFRWVKAGKLPAPDVRVNQRVIRWRRSTVEWAIAFPFLQIGLSGPLGLRHLRSNRRVRLEGNHPFFRSVLMSATPWVA